MWFKFIFLVTLALGLEAKILSIDKMEVDTDPNYVKVSANLHAMDGANVVNVDIDVLKDESDVTYQVTVYRHNVDHFEHFYKSDLESGCNHGDIKDPVLVFIFKETQKYGNITEACPLKIGHYQLRNFKIDSADLPHEMPAGNYRFEFSAFIKKDGRLHDIYTDKYYFSA